MDANQTMTSLLCNKQSGGVVDVHDKDCVEQLTIDADNKIQTTVSSHSERMKPELKKAVKQS